MIIRYAGLPVNGLSTPSTNGVGTVTGTSFTGDGTNGTLGQSYQVYSFAIGSSTTSGQFAFDLSGVDLFDTVMSGTISGSGPLTYNGSGQLSLTAANTYEGGTTITGGLLEAANASALGAGGVTIESGATLRLAASTIIPNAINNSGTLQFAGGGLRRTSSADLATVMELVAGTAESPLVLNPSISWLPRDPAATFSDVLSLENTSGSVQILQMQYDPSLLAGSIVEADLFLGWKTGDSWVNAVDGNFGSAGVSALANQTESFTSLGITPTSEFLGSWGRDIESNTVWAVVNHNSDFSVVAVPEPGTLTLLVGAATLLAAVRRRTLGHLSA